MTSAVGPAWCQTTVACSSSRQAGGQRVVLAVDQHGLDVPGADPQGLQGDHLPVLVVVGQEAEPGAAQVADPIERLAHARPTGWKRGWWWAPG